ncbi:MAG: t(6)A37 threonylcarbamoyladenosine biosynthesis protein RimN [Candidatus Accumulibacter appositus]|uniref:Threonylcarbamoyl-AMP synthase n=1 Tax=Candidatus Accumulibacter appositus TaxID=1454003 RepID=A0A011NZP1_9PROT|nr:L-threonylcarbamoyladenylate synthase [Accumulibacter sp.]EXI80831.1 MAG: t(6)A37 threonylcarbamoyladenosine biosynthesis protein RimN [Candidatus Accumulibacter appositus]HRF06345.1 L-threonylcarbamoyladenylate synthase [Accumulibacter sp.]
MFPEQAEIDHAVALLQAGELVAFPTETVYGLAADAANPLAVARIFAAKGRPANHPLIVHLAGAGCLERWARDIPSPAWELAEAFWPGPLTLILRRAAAVPTAVTGGQDSIGVRVPAHPVALALLRAYAEAGGGVDGMCGLAAPSANRFGRISPTEARHVREELGDSVPLILDGGRCLVGIESTILDLTRGDSQPPRLLRPGRVTPEQIAAVIGVLPETPSLAGNDGSPRVSGSLAAHYAPRTALHLVAPQRLAEVIDQLHRAGRRCAILCHSEPPAAIAATDTLRKLAADPRGYARALYAALRALDQLAAELIVVEDVPATPAWAAVADRLRRAAVGAGRHAGPAD